MPPTLGVGHNDDDDNNCNNNTYVAHTSGGGTGRGDWKTDGRHYRRCQGVQIPVPAAVRGTTEGECGLISKHVHRQLARCKPLFHVRNVLVPTGFVLVGQ